MPNFVDAVPPAWGVPPLRAGLGLPDARFAEPAWPLRLLLVVWSPIDGTTIPSHHFDDLDTDRVDPSVPALAGTHPTSLLL